MKYMITIEQFNEMRARIASQHAKYSRGGGTWKNPGDVIPVTVPYDYGNDDITVVIHGMVVILCETVGEYIMSGCRNVCDYADYADVFTWLRDLKRYACFDNYVDAVANDDDNRITAREWWQRFAHDVNKWMNDNVSITFNAD